MNSADLKSVTGEPSSSAMIMKEIESKRLIKLTDIAHKLDWASRIDIIAILAAELTQIHSTSGQSHGDFQLNKIYVDTETNRILLCPANKYVSSDIPAFGKLIMDLTIAGHVPPLSDAKLAESRKTTWAKIVDREMPSNRCELAELFKRLTLNCFLADKKRRPTANQLAKIFKPIATILNIAKTSLLKTNPIASTDCPNSELISPQTLTPLNVDTNTHQIHSKLLPEKASPAPFFN